MSELGIVACFADACVCVVVGEGGAVLTFRLLGHLEIAVWGMFALETCSREGLPGLMWVGDV